MLNFKPLLIIAVSASLLASCGGGENKKDKSAQIKELKQQQKELQTKIDALEAAMPKKDSGRVIPVTVTSMSPSVFSNYIDVQGKVDVDEVVNAIPEMPGIIESILVKPGQYVRKGQVVARLRSESITKGIDQIDQQIAFAKTMYEKQKRLWDQEIGTEVQLLSAKHQYEALLKQKQTNLTQKNSFNVYSPINGVVDAVDATVGQSYSNPMGAPVIRIINTGKLKIQARIAENYAGIVRTGSPVMIIFPDMHDSLPTKIAYAERLIDNATKTFAAYIPLPANASYQPNMTAQVRIATYTNTKAFVLPIGVIQKTDKGDFVFIAGADGKAQMRQISTGRTYMGRAEVLDGLTLGDQVITVGYDELNDGDRIEIQP
jgi:RND family efflux transporter MFP subunit